MRALKSATGAAFATLYVFVFAVAYLLYLRNAGQFLADAPIMLAALPYTLTLLELFGSVNLSGDDLREVLAAALFCAALAYAMGALVESFVRGAFRMVRARRRASGTAG